MKAIIVEQPGPLLETLSKQLRNRTQVKKWLKLRRLAVNGETASRHDQPLKAGDVVSVGPAAPPRSASGAGSLRVLHEDDAILVIDKPSGLLTIATDAVKTNTAYYKATEYVRRQSRRRDARIYIVHRLDRETSGVLLFAKTSEAKEELQAEWDGVEKRYLALVEGIPGEPTGTIRGHLTEASVFRVFAGPPTKRSKLAVTHYRVLKSGADRSLLEVRTETGRKHQIRVHLAELGHPIVGDDKYGRRRRGERLALHASSLRFKHPTGGAAVECRSPLPTAISRGLS